VSLEEGLARQQAARRAVASGASGPAIFICEHDPVYTIGRAGVRREFPEGDPRRWPNVRSPAPVSAAPAEPDVPAAYPVIELDRGGDVTYHGPGQVMVYPVLPLKRVGVSLVGYIRALEASGVAALARWRLEAHARDGLTGVWVDIDGSDAKIGSIGIACRRWITYHGMSLNVSCDLAAFDAITPCGIEGVRVTSLAEIMGRAPPSIDELGRAVAECLAREVGLKLARRAAALVVTR
jgi:lipoyl(octanoyl) transferase